MARNPITHIFKEAFSHTVSGNPDLVKELSDWKKTRRQFIRDLSLAAGAVTLIPACVTEKKIPEIVIVGAGMAGLNAAYQLNKKGIKSSLYEGSARAGGRMFTMKDQFGKGITTDVGGEFVDTSHTDILQLMKEFNLPFYDLRTDKGAPKTFFFGGKLLDQDDLRAAILPFAGQIAKDILTLPAILDYTTAKVFGHFDNMSITQYLNSLGIQGWLFDFINVVLTREYGMEAKEQSAINFLIMFVPPVNSDKNYELFGPAHEVYKIKGGSQRLTDRMYETLKEQVVFNHRLTGIRSSANGRYELIFTHQNKDKILEADYILITIPFSILRNISMDVPMPSAKRKCINEIGYGNSCKFIVGMNHKPWRKANRQGYTFTDQELGAGWDSSQMQSDVEGSFTVFGGGDFGNIIQDSREADLKMNIIRTLNQIYPGVDEAYNNKNLKWCWGNFPFSKGGYSAFKIGQWSTLSGWEAVPVGNIYFAGEHVSKDCQGYMNGAAETSRVAVEKMLLQIQKN